MVTEVRKGFRQEEAFILNLKNAQVINQGDKGKRLFQVMGTPFKGLEV